MTSKIDLETLETRSKADPGRPVLILSPALTISPGGPCPNTRSRTAREREKRKKGLNPKPPVLRLAASSGDVVIVTATAAGAADIGA